MLSRSTTCFSECYGKRAFRSFPSLKQQNFRKSSLGNRGLRTQRHLQERAFSTNSKPPTLDSTDSPIRISQLLGALLVFGIGATSWGLYEFYSTLTMWPKEVRDDLRAGLKAKHSGDMKLARRHLTKAWSTIQTMTSNSLSPDPYLKFSGVAVVLAEVLEGEQELDEAFSVLKAALVAFINGQNSLSSDSSNQTLGATNNVPSTSSSTSTPSSNTSWSTSTSPRRSLATLLDSRSSAIKSQLDSNARVRAVAIALKLGDLAETLRRPDEEEHWLGFAVTEVLCLIRDECGLTHDSRRGFQTSSGPSVTSATHNGSKATDQGSPGDNKVTSQGQDRGDIVRDILSPGATDDELGLPAWVSLTKTELAAPMERLGAFYARQGKYGNAILLYRVASSLLVRSKPSSPNSVNRASPPSTAELCQALQIENAHMALMMDLRRVRPNDTQIQHDLPRVLTRAVQIYDEAVRRHGSGSPRDDGIAVDSEISLCDETYPAVLYNAGIYYEEEGQLEQALRSYTLSYRALHTHGNREMMYAALENARRLQRVIDKNKKQGSETPSGNTSALTDGSLEAPAQK